ncbi:hypothetical protein ABTN24_20200, partial [Acinetobacter baumannii]
ANTLVVAQRCAVLAPKRKPILPSLAGDRDGEAALLRAQATAGLEKRLQRIAELDKLPPPGAGADDWTQPYRDRLAFEL